MTLAALPDAATLAAAAMLVSPWKPVVMLIPFIAWAWFVSAVLDKHAKRFFLGQETWGLVHLLAAALALAAVVLLPIPGIGGFLAAFAVATLILAIDAAAFVVIANKDERVPEAAHLKLDTKSWKESRDAKAVAKKQGSSTLTIVGPNKMAVPVPDKESPEFGVRLAAEELFLRAGTQRASQVDVAPAGANAYAASFLIDGVRQAGEPIPPADAIKIIDFWKAAAGLDVADRRRKLSGSVSARTAAESTDVRVTTSGSQAGMRLTLLMDPAKAVRRKFSDLGLLDSQAQAIKELVNTDGGAVLVAGGSDGGRTTTLYALTKLHDAYTSNVQTLELEMDDAIEGVKQNIFDPTKEGAEFAIQLRSMLRRDPDVVAVADLPDVQTAQEIAKADLDRTRVYLSMKADSALAAVQMYVKAVGDPAKAAAGLRGVVAHKLVRALCDNCRVPYAPPAELLKKLGLPLDKVQQLFKKGGQVLIRNKPEICPACGGIGYVGQTGLFEVYPVGDAERALIAKQDWQGLRAELRKRQLPSMQQAAMRKAVEGVTSIEEIMRVTAPKDAAPKAAVAAE